MPPRCWWEWSQSGVLCPSHLLLFYFSGIYHEPNCSSYLTNHAVLVVGYGFEGNETDGNNYWLIKNRYKLPKYTQICI